MKNITSLIILLLFSTVAFSQTVKDTVVVVVDTTTQYVKYSESIIPNESLHYNEGSTAYGKKTFRIAIKGHYLDGTDYDDSAVVVLDKIYKGHWKVNILCSEIKVLKKDLEKYSIVSSEYLNKANQRNITDAFRCVLPSSHTWPFHFVVFKSDLVDKSKDYVTMHSVLANWSTVVY